MHIRTLMKRWSRRWRIMIWIQGGGMHLLFYVIAMTATDAKWF